MKRRFRLNRRAISTVLATVFFLGIAISVALALFIMSSTYNNLYQQQLQVREDRLRESISLVAGSYGWYSTSKKDYIENMTLTVKNTGSVTAHIVSVYYNDVLVDNSLSKWVSPAERTETGLIILPNGTELDYFHDRITVSTDRGTTATNTWIGLGAQPPGGGKITAYQFQILGLNPTPAQRHGGTQFTLFQLQYWYYVIPTSYLSELEYTAPAPTPPTRFLDNPNVTSYDPQAAVGATPGIQYAIWMEEIQLEQKQQGGNYTIKGVRWAFYNTTLGGQIHPVLLTIPSDWPTFTWNVGMIFEPTAHVYIAPAVWTMTLASPSGPLYVGDQPSISGGASFTGGYNYENLKDVAFTISVNSTDYKIMSEYPPGKKIDETINYDLIVNSAATPYPYQWGIKFTRPGTYTVTVKVTAATGMDSGDKKSYVYPNAPTGIASIVVNILSKS